MNGYLEYLEWYFTVSHPRIISFVKHEEDIEPFNVGGPFDVVSPPPHGVDDQQRLQMITAIIDNLMSLVSPNGEIYTLYYLYIMYYYIDILTV